MLSRPDGDEWNVASLPLNRRSILEGAHSFEDIAQAICNCGRIYSWLVECYDGREAKGARRAVFSIAVPDRLFDLFYNAPDGLRGRYWQSPDAGHLATGHLMDLLKPRLLSFAQTSCLHNNEKDVSDMTLEEIRSSMSELSAKAWPAEKDKTENCYRDTPKEHRLKVPRWEKNESEQGSKGKQWRWTPSNGDLEIKGAFLNEFGVEHVPEIKLDRSCQIHRYGFT